MRNVKGTLHWVSIQHAITAEVRIYDRLFSNESPDSDPEKDFMEFLNPDSLKVITGYLEPFLANAKKSDRFQFQRLGYFNVDSDSAPEKLVFNKTVGLRDSWAKQKPKPQQKQGQPKPQQQQASALSTIYKLGKKLANLPEEKRLATIVEIQKLAVNLSEEEVKGFFGTAAKKVGTRLAGLEALYAYAKAQSKEFTEISGADAFVTLAKEDAHELLVQAAQKF